MRWDQARVASQRTPRERVTPPPVGHAIDNDVADRACIGCGCLVCGCQPGVGRANVAVRPRRDPVRIWMACCGKHPLRCICQVDDP